MKLVKYKSTELFYDEVDGSVYVNGNKDTSGLFSPSFIDNGDDKPTFIGFIDNNTRTFISLTGKSLGIIESDKVEI